ncbi:insulinase family protein [Peptoniphilus sp. oral taxon 386]|uniref:insulinase family protein n=1 Tax=Peptoniphilus sp. oral taxon 386 TaxID=652713 RepID=UPI0001DA9EE4|nr:insulinase family protein [Peptoniphilus sp. oral taxon 386]EFI41530.1 peptidase M16 inactive domain protein [Peptoniphilus sp. oral taxon 386 str. F0131]
MNNYKLLNEEYISEVASTARVYEHKSTKAKILTLSNNDENKAFGIGFRTIPTDATGVAHIVEHCVLSGSRKYKTREPFMDLIKSSMQTFLNAMTFPDKTIYPVSSRNKKDFYNLMDVYLDSVFYPRMYEKKEIFLQEGWHYELENKEAPLKYNGVVYNEMKGVYSDPQNIVSDAITFNLHKNSSYGIDSGGDPKDIPNLTYENFLAFHKKFYHPSNSYIYLYGDLDMEEALDYIDREYLSNFEYKKINSEIILNDPIQKQERVTETYSVSENELGENKDFLGYSWCLGNADNQLDLFMRNFLAELLIDSNSSPIKTALLQNGFAEDVYAETSTSKALDLSIVAKNTDSSKINEFKSIIENCLRKVVENGIDKNLLEATLNKFEFAFREGGGTQRSIIYYIRALNLWLYDLSPIDGLKANDLINEIREKINSNFIEDYIEKKLLNNNYSILISVVPEVNKSVIEENECAKKLEAYKKTLSDEELENIIKQHQELIEFQMTEDSEEDKNTIPSLELSDIKDGITHIPHEIYDEKHAKLLFNEQFTNEISYITLSFDIAHISQDKLKDMSIMTDLIGKLSTEKYNYHCLDSEIYKTMGGFVINPTTYKDYSTKNNFSPRLNLSFKTLDVNFEKSVQLVEEIINSTTFDDKNRIRELLLMEKSSDEATILQNGHNIVMETVKSYFSRQAAYNAQLNGLENYFYLSDLINNFEEEFEKFKVSLIELKKLVFNKNNLVINYTGSRKSLEINKKYILELAEKLDDSKYEISEFEMEPTPKNQAFTTSAGVQYVSKGYDIEALGEEYSGILTVLGSILSTNYLHYNIRAKGGAYGAGVKFTMSSDMMSYSYRDPHLKNTIDVYDNMYKFLEELTLSTSELKNFIIGSVNSFDPLLSPSAKGDINLVRYLSNITEEKLSKHKKEALSATLEDLKKFAPLIKKAMDKNYLCVIGGEEKIKEHSDLFNEIINLKK